MEYRSFTITDRFSGLPIINTKLPEGFTGTAEFQKVAYPLSESYTYSGMYRNADNSCQLFIKKGSTFLFSRQNSMPEDTVTQDGSIVSSPTTLKEQLDKLASSFTGSSVSGVQYLNLSDEMNEYIYGLFRKTLDITVQDLNLSLGLAQFPMGFLILNYLLDGGIALYDIKENDNSYVLAVATFRSGMEKSIIQGYGINEQLSQKPFGYADLVHGTLDSSSSWGLPFEAYMISKASHSENLEIFSTFFNNCRFTPEFETYDKNLHDYNIQKNYTQAQNSIAQNQAMINAVMMEQNQRWAFAQDFQRSLSRDLDSWRERNWNTMQQNDRRFFQNSYTGRSVSGESSDDRIQRWRHEATMGVNTYERDDGTEVEFSTRADRVFESNLDNLSHFGTEHYYEDYVPKGWHEIHRKD